MAITYYRDTDVLVSSAGLRIGGRQYPLGEVARIWHRRGRRRWGAAAGRGVLGLAMLTPIAVGALGVAVALVLHASAATTIALIGGARISTCAALIVLMTVVVYGGLFAVLAHASSFIGGVSAAAAPVGELASSLTSSSAHQKHRRRGDRT